MKENTPTDDKFACFVMKLNLSGLTGTKIIMWLAAIMIASFVIGFGILAVTDGLSGTSPGKSTPFRHGAMLSPNITAIPLDGATSGRIGITMGAGELSLSGGAPARSFSEVTVFSRAPEWQPEYTQSFNGTTKVLAITDPGHEGKEWFSVDSPNRWDIRVTDQVPVELSVALGAGDSALDLNGLTLTRLSVSNGAGETTIDLGRYSRSPFTADIHNGIGDLTIRIPRTSSTRISVHQGVGDIDAKGLVQHDEYYSTDSYNPSLPANEILINQGVGDISIETV